MSRNKFNVEETLVDEFNALHIKRLLRYIRPHGKAIAAAVGMMLIAAGASLTAPYLVKVALDTAIPNGDVRLLWILTIIYVGTLVANGIGMKYRIRLMPKIGQEIILRLRSDVFHHIQKLPFSYYDSRPHGKILVRVVNYVNSLSDLLSNGIINLITDLFTLVFIIAMMFVIDPRLTLICMAGLPVLFLGVFGLKNLQRKAWQAVSSKQSSLNAYIHESLSGVKVTQSCTRERENERIFSGLNEDMVRAWMHALKIMLLIWPMIEILSTLGVATVYLAGALWFKGTVSIGTLIAFVSYVWRFWAPIANLGNFYNAIVTASAYLERIFETLDEEARVEDAAEALDLPTIRGHVEFKNVNFSYETGPRILHDISFQTQPGTSVAIVGSTGGGKTTIVSLLARFYNTLEGAILVDGIDIQGVTIASLRSQMGIMLQDTFLFSGSILDNIRYSRLDATDAEVENAAKLVHAHDFIMAMKEGYLTQVNERGSRLSMGQRQLLSFARALLADPRILILDEATSSVDTETELAVQKGLKKLMENRTSFIIAHRLSTIRDCNTILYLDHGRILERGNHDELIALKGHYHGLFTGQYTGYLTSMA